MSSGLRSQTSNSSATFDPQTSDWFVREKDTVTVVDEGRTGASDRLELTQSTTDDRPIAFNSSDGLLYVIDPSKRQLDALDLDGNVQKSFRLASSELSDPVAMTFAPSTDPTDDAGRLNLFVAGAGDDTTLGGVTAVASGSQVVERRVDASRDDAEESASGDVSYGSQDLELVEENSVQEVGLRFHDLALPHGAAIVSATVQFKADETESVATNLTLRAQAAENAPTLCSTANDISSRPLTTASAAWSPAPWTRSARRAQITGAPLLQVTYTVN